MPTATGTAIPIPETEGKSVQPVPTTITTPTAPITTVEKKEYPATTPSETNVLPNTSKPKNETGKKNIRKALFQEDEHGIAEESSKKTKK